MAQKFIYSITLAFVSSITLYGQGKDSIRTELLQDVNITATRANEENFKTAGSILVFTSKDFQTYQPRTVPEALMGAVGVFVQKTAHGGGSPFLRGLTGNQSLILIDGIRLNNSTFRYGPNQYLNTIDPFTVNKIEVFRGGGSVAFGSDALGGTLQLLTKELSFSEKTAIHGKGVARHATGGMENSVHAEIEMSGSKFAIHGGFTTQDFGDLIAGKATGKQSPSGYEQRSFDAKALLGISKNWSATFAHQYLVQQQVPLYYRYSLENFALNKFDPQERSLSYFKLKHKSNNKLINQVNLSGSFQATHEARISQKKPTDPLRTETDKVKTAGLTLNVISQVRHNWNASSGVEVYNDLVKSMRTDQLTTGSSTVQSRGLYPDNSKHLSYAIYSLHQIKADKWSFSFGGRFNGFRIEAMDEALGKTIITPSALVGNAAIAFSPASSSNVYISFNTGFRAPNIDDMGTLGIVDFRYELPSYNLKPETSNNFETGYKFRHKGLAFNVALFQNNLQNLIARVQEPGRQINGVNVYRKENVERAYIRGVELDAEYLFNRNWKMYGSAAYAHGENITKNEPVRRIPPFNGRFGFEYRRQGWYLRPETLFADKQNRLAAGDESDNRIQKGGTPGWLVLNVMAGYDAKHFSINAVAQNLDNKDYRTHGSGINGVGRSLWLTATGRF